MRELPDLRAAKEAREIEELRREFLWLSRDGGITEGLEMVGLACPCCWAELAQSVACGPCAWDLTKIPRCPTHDPELRMSRVRHSDEPTPFQLPDIAQATRLLHEHLYHRLDGPTVSADELLGAIREARHYQSRGVKALNEWEALPASERRKTWDAWGGKLVLRLDTLDKWCWDAEVSLLGLGQSTKTLCAQLRNISKRNERAEILRAILAMRLQAFRHDLKTPHDLIDPDGMAARLRTAREYGLDGNPLLGWVHLLLEREAAASLAREQSAADRTLREMLPDERPNDWCHRWEKLVKRKGEMEQYGWFDVIYPALKERIEQYAAAWKSGEDILTRKEREWSA